MEKLYLKELRNWIFSKSGFVYIIIISFLLINNSATAQMECRSMIGAHLTPIGENGKVSWAVEGTMAPGIMTSPVDSLENTKLNGGMILAALELKLSNKSNFYIEGGYKNWVNSELVNDDDLKSRHIGIRQLFYSYSSDNTKIKLGLHETRLGNFFLVDERVLGGSLDKEIGALTFNFRAATVVNNFARMGKFCSNRHLYGVLHPDYTERIGKKVGETNMAGIVINWNPNYEKSETMAISDAEFSDSGDEFIDSDDEFHENHDFNDSPDSDEFGSTNTNLVSLNNIGLILYDEFGSIDYIPENKTYIGTLFDFGLPNEFFLQAGAVYQNLNSNNTIVYIAKLNRSKTWNNASNTKFSAAYIGKININDNAVFQPLFSNLFLGEIMRLDAPDFPLWQAAVKHRFPGKMKFHIALKAVGQIEDPKTNEENIELGMLTFKNHLKVTLVGSRVQSMHLDNDIYTARLEMRLAF